MCLKHTVIVALLLAAIGCAPDRGVIVDDALQTGALHYPPGTDIKSISESHQPEDKFGLRYDIRGFCDTLEDGFATAVLARANPSTRPTGYYRVLLPRAGAKSSFGAFGLYFDYVFVDSNERVVFAARRRVD